MIPMIQALSGQVLSINRHSELRVSQFGTIHVSFVRRDIESVQSFGEQMMDGDYPSSDQLIDWARSQVEFSDIIHVRDLPWSRMTLLRLGDSGHWLKQLRGDAGQTLRKIQIISETFPAETPAVTASNIEAGGLLFAHVPNQPFPESADFGAYAAALKSYADTQCRSVRDENIIRELPDCNLDQLVSNLLAFLKTDGAGAAAFIGRHTALAYHEALSRAEPKLRALLATARSLPKTLCHCDLRPGNIGFQPDGTPLLFDWDDAKAGPAGLSLHGMLGGCAQAVRFLSLDDEAAGMASGTFVGSVTSFYANALVEGGYMAADELRAGLAGAITAGVIDHLITFGNFPPFHDESTEESAATILRHLDDLLDLCTFFAETDPALCGSLATFFAGSGGLARAIPLVRIMMDGQDAAVQRAVEAEATRIGPDRAARALRCLDIATQINRMRDIAEAPETVPHVTFDEADQRDQEVFWAKQDLALDLFRTYGVVMVENAFPQHQIEKCRDQFLQKYRSYFVERDHDDALRVGDKRYMVTVDIEGAFNSPSVYMSPVMEPLLKRTLGDDMIVGSFNVITSLPGSQDQGIHQDHPLLFPDAPELTTPDFAVNMIAPLIPLDEHVGTTCVAKGTQFMPRHIAEQMPRQVPEVPVGSALLLSYRVTHFGLGNRSTQVRPILSINYHRAWFRDQVNHVKNTPVSISADQLVRVPAAMQHLFSWMRSEP